MYSNIKPTGSRLSSTNNSLGAARNWLEETLEKVVIKSRSINNRDDANSLDYVHNWYWDWVSRRVTSVILRFLIGCINLILFAAVTTSLLAIDNPLLGYLTSFLKTPVKAVTDSGITTTTPLLLWLMLLFAIMLVSFGNFVSYSAILLTALMCIYKSGVFSAEQRTNYLIITMGVVMLVYSLVFILQSGEETPAFVSFLLPLCSYTTVICGILAIMSSMGFKSFTASGSAASWFMM